MSNHSNLIDTHKGRPGTFASMLSEAMEHLWRCIPNILNEPNTIHLQQIKLEVRATFS